MFQLQRGIVFLLFFLVFVGFFEKLRENPIGTLVYVGLAFILYFVIKHFIGKGKPYAKIPSKHLPRHQKPKKKKVRNAPFPFRVIEGNKDKKKQKKLEG
ncbi:hypothetical protein L1765_09365 [Microaerobacter geothermalis]|uniref:hypothetical protein n=1 Tax=Microaerobacter geothermalis TaxID=674972 RepID=UPI001F334F6A|nr:hypothetical protein [Microaerobacter geothermalis]MCF6094171.1 hypothetical protein [Microaerobacter geothermalis]